MAKYFHAANANRLIADAVFELYDRVAGTAMGVYEANDEKEIAELSKLAKDPTSAVDEISQEEYEKLRKKKAVPYGNLIHLRDPSPFFIKGKGGAEVVDGSKAPEPTGPAQKPAKTLDNVEEALSVGKIEGEPEEQPVEHHPYKKGKRK